MSQSISLSPSDLQNKIKQVNNIKQSLFGQMDVLLGEFIAQQTDNVIQQLNKEYFKQNKQTIYNSFQYSIKDHNSLQLISLSLAPTGDAFAQLLYKYGTNLQQQIAFLLAIPKNILQECKICYSNRYNKTIEKELEKIQTFSTRLCLKWITQDWENIQQRNSSKDAQDMITETKNFSTDENIYIDIFTSPPESFNQTMSIYQQKSQQNLMQHINLDFQGDDLFILRAIYKLNQSINYYIQFLIDSKLDSQMIACIIAILARTQKPVGKDIVKSLGNSLLNTLTQATITTSSLFPLHEMKKVILLFNGSIDSISTAIYLKNHNFDVLLLNFQSDFFGGHSKRLNECAIQLNLPIMIVPINIEYIKLLSAPKSPYGAGFNPCVACRAFMLRYAYVLQRLLNYDFIATGDVYNQHEFSQSEASIAKTDKISGIPAPPLRPLSQRLFPTNSGIQRQIGLLKENFLTFQGSGHKEQEKLLKDAKIYLRTSHNYCDLLKRELGNKFKVLRNDGVFLLENKKFLDLVKFGTLFRIERLRYCIAVSGIFTQRFNDKFIDENNVFLIQQSNFLTVFGFTFVEEKLKEAQNNQDNAMINKTILQNAKQTFDEIQNMKSKGERLICLTVQNEQNIESQKISDLLLPQSQNFDISDPFIQLCINVVKYINISIFNRRHVDAKDQVTCQLRSGDQLTLNISTQAQDFKDVEEIMYK